jgi:hypothetical protein
VAGGAGGKDRSIVVKTLEPLSVLVSSSVLSRVSELKASVGVLVDAVHSLVPTAALVDAPTPVVDIDAAAVSR